MYGVMFKPNRRVWINVQTERKDMEQTIFLTPDNY